MMYADNALGASILLSVLDFYYQKLYPYYMENAI